MKHIHIVVPDLFLPQQLARYIVGDLRLPALEKLLAKARQSDTPAHTLEAWLCGHLGVETSAIAPLTLQADGLQADDAYWLRADPVAFSMQRDQMVLQGNLALHESEAAQLCDSLNRHFAEDGLQFFAPHPQRWYLRLGHVPAMETWPLPQVIGSDMNAHLPHGADALRWHGVFNEIQMLFYEHEVNQARERRGEVAVSGLWLWGGGKQTGELRQPFAAVAGDSVLAQAFAQATKVPALPGIAEMLAQRSDNGVALLVWEGMRTALQNADVEGWREAVVIFEKRCIQPLLVALTAGKVSGITLEALNDNGSKRFVVTRGMRWKIWRLSKPLSHYACVSHAP